MQIYEELGSQRSDRPGYKRRRDQKLVNEGKAVLHRF